MTVGIAIGDFLRSQLEHLYGLQHRIGGISWPRQNEKNMNYTVHHKHENMKWKLKSRKEIISHIRASSNS